jgi:hypothetical protein
MGGNSRAVAAVNPPNSRFISLCSRLNSAKGSKPSRGKSESMVSPLRRADRDWRGTQASFDTYRTDRNFSQVRLDPLSPARIDLDQMLRFWARISLTPAKAA